ncbi:hypothetical protein RCL_jg10524.t1 [Rhizophagus clarus]|uniref:Uncharacterized protein n=1 Tax=Rhizophagus clarus TaxID=94130 RepID=A0A8H3L5P2_9GLOM|nr:hypothetical protein RCL_jg10524.t1 [Rhizophagus clarus]
MLKQLTVKQKVQAIQLLKLDLNSRKIATRISENVHYSGISRLKMKYEETNSVNDKSKTKRLYKLTDYNERISMIRHIMTDEYFTAVNI